MDSRKKGRGTANPKPVRASRPRSCKRKIESDTPGCAADTHCEMTSLKTKRLNSHNDSPLQDQCPICLSVVEAPTVTKCCGQKFCSSCLDKSLCSSPYCPICRTPLRKIIGNQPPGTMSTSRDSIPLPGYEHCGTITIRYSVPSGIQGPGHPNPGRPFSGTERLAYLPDNSEGRDALKLLEKAWDAKLIFTVGTSHTTGVTNTVVWNDIHHKTSRSGEPFGYPDMMYLSRLKEELASRGIVL